MLRALIFKLFPKLGAAIEAESRTWFLCCPDCGHEISVWDAGGIRYGASGNPRIYTRCEGCGEKKWLRMERRSPDG